MSSPTRLVRNPEGGKIAGVCAGLAEYFDVDVTLVRLAWVVLAIVPGGIIGGLVAYVAAWAIMPSASVRPQVEAASRRLTRSTVDRKIAGVCGGLAEYLNVDATVVRLIWAVLSVVPGCIVLGIIAYLAGWFIMPVPQVPLAKSASSPA